MGASAHFTDLYKQIAGHTLSLLLYYNPCGGQYHWLSLQTRVKVTASHRSPRLMIDMEWQEVMNNVNEKNLLCTEWEDGQKNSEDGHLVPRASS